MLQDCFVFILAYICATSRTFCKIVFETFTQDCEQLENTRWLHVNKTFAKHFRKGFMLYT